VNIAAKIIVMRLRDAKEGRLEDIGMSQGTAL
jgi:hypothetical protein